MDSTIIIRIVAGVLFAVTLFYLIQRRRKKVMESGICAAGYGRTGSRGPPAGTNFPACLTARSKQSLKREKHETNLLCLQPNS